MKVLSAESNLASATNVGNSTVVRVYNSDSSAGTITKKDAAGNTLGTMTVPSGEVVYCEKQYTDTLEGGATLKASQIAYSNMMYYASAASGGGGVSHVTSNLRMHLDADGYSGSGNWLDTSSNSNNGTIVGATFNSSSPKHFSFDGTNDRVDISDGTGTGLDTHNLMSGGNNYSINLWLSPDSFPDFTGYTESNNYLVSPLLFKTGRRTIYIGIGDGSPNNKLHIRVNHGGTWSTPVLSNTLSLNTYYNICFTYNSSDGYVCYQNGSSVSTSNTTGADVSTFFLSDTNIAGETSLPSQTETSRYFDGKVPIVSVYEETLTSSEVEQNFNAFKSRFGY